MINELWFCAQLRYIILVYSRACDTERLSNFMTSLKGKSEHCGSPGDHIKVFIIQYRKGRGFFLPFFLNEKILFHIAEGEAGRKFLPFKLNGFKMH